jgi:hypothetical protein
MITFKIEGHDGLGRLENQKFTVPGDPETESILNNLTILHPVATGGSPDPDYEVFVSIAKHWPFLKIVSRDQPPPRREGVIY